MNISRPKLHNKNAKHAAVNRKGQKGWRKTAFPRGASFCRRARVCKTLHQGNFGAEKWCMHPIDEVDAADFEPSGFDCLTILRGVWERLRRAHHTHTLSRWVGVTSRSVSGAAVTRQGQRDVTGLPNIPQCRCSQPAGAHTPRPPHYPLVRPSERPNQERPRGPSLKTWLRTARSRLECTQIFT